MSNFLKSIYFIVGSKFISSGEIILVWHKKYIILMWIFVTFFSNVFVSGNILYYKIDMAWSACDKMTSSAEFTGVQEWLVKMNS